MRSWFVEHGALARGAFVVTVLVSLAVLFAPPGDVPPTPYGIDEVVHGALFAALAFTARWAGVGRAVTAGLMVLYAAVSEALQATDLVQRDASLGDWLADVVGVLVGLVAWRLVERARPRS
ncbi:VanZ like family protein [Klenkia soli]|uniref:VanZ like family protein n=1 Tax=Klenkia soli TaxID=1052260 RepID=A0A1H0I7M2_9ACTN|nr:hypothetical protein [Klenkia soli]SDO27408.1 VanZ like family protein [Klenkia soli]